MENELQTVVAGDRRDVDLPIIIKESRFYRNMLKRAASGDAPKKALTSLEQFVEENPENVWENSWVRFPRRVLNRYAENVFERDLLADKRDWTGPRRKDADCFRVTKAGEEHVRVPVSYLLKLALADCLGESRTHPAVRGAGGEFSGAFFQRQHLPGNLLLLSPVSEKRGRAWGAAAARETLLRFLLCRFLTEYANEKVRTRPPGPEGLRLFRPPILPFARKRSTN